MYALIVAGAMLVAVGAAFFAGARWGSSRVSRRIFADRELGCRVMERLASVWGARLEYSSPYIGPAAAADPDERAGGRAA